MVVVEAPPAAGAVVVALVDDVVVAVELAVVVLDEDDEWPIIRSSLWQPPSVSIKAAVQARTEIRIKQLPCGSVSRAKACARKAHADAVVS